MLKDKFLYRKCRNTSIDKQYTKTRRNNNIDLFSDLPTHQSINCIYYNRYHNYNFKPLEESYAKVTDADTKFFESNKRTASQQSTILNEMAADRADAAKKIADQNKKILDDKIAIADKDKEIDKKTLEINIFV